MPLRRLAQHVDQRSRGRREASSDRGSRGVSGHVDLLLETDAGRVPFADAPGAPASAAEGNDQLRLREPRVAGHAAFARELAAVRPCSSREAAGRPGASRGAAFARRGGFAVGVVFAAGAAFVAGVVFAAGRSSPRATSSPQCAVFAADASPRPTFAADGVFAVGAAAAAFGAFVTRAAFGGLRPLGGRLRSSAGLRRLRRLGGRRAAGALARGAAGREAAPPCPWMPSPRAGRPPSPRAAASSPASARRPRRASSRPSPPSCARPCRPSRREPLGLGDRILRRVERLRGRLLLLALRHHAPQTELSAACSTVPRHRIAGPFRDPGPGSRVAGGPARAAVSSATRRPDARWRAATRSSKGKPMDRMLRATLAAATVTALVAGALGGCALLAPPRRDSPTRRR